MMYWDGDWNGWAWLAMILSMIAFWTVVLLVVLMVVRRPTSSTAAVPATTSAEAVLRQRYAAGEIDDREFERRLTTLQQHGSVAVGVND